MTRTAFSNPKSATLELFSVYTEGKPLNIRNQIIELNLGLVRKEAHHWSKQCQESYEELMQIGCLGLIRAIERFDLTQNHAFSSFAVPYIRGEIQHYLRDRSSSVRIPRRWLELQTKAKQFCREFRTQHQCQPSDREIALNLEISLKEWQEVKLAQHNRHPLSLDVPVGDSNENTHLLDTVPDGNYRSFQLAQEDRMRLQAALAQVEDKTRKVLEFVFLKDLTQKQAAEELGISVITVSRRVKKGVKCLQDILN
ncbi:MAG: RNA polymerase sigma factor SigF [Synechococcaceae cyanobacterium RL_1_2]|nr:RNA polymerase sigma factor SigF [Synechococcaceae cyanobacterium RL_1_2]